jgi:hypothetical protein
MSKTYPEHLIPNSQLSILQNNNIDKSEYIGAWIDTKHRLKDADGNLNGSAIDLHKLPTFSCNKIPLSVPVDLNIEFEPTTKHLYLHEWHDGEDGLTPPPEHFDYVNRHLYFLKISDIEYQGEYFNPWDDEENHYAFNVRLVHKPTVSNFWHFQFEIVTEHGIIEKNKNRWINELCGSIRGQIVKYAIFDLP